MDWLKRSIDDGVAIVARIFTEQYIKSMKALGYDSVNIVSAGENPGPSNSKVYCHRDLCIVDSNETGFYMVHSRGCPFEVVTRDTASQGQETFDLNNLVMEKREEAELVLSNMNKFVSRSGFVTVADFLEIVGITPRTYHDFYRGWRDLSSATVEQTDDGQYRISFPPIQEPTENSSGRV